MDLIITEKRFPHAYEYRRLVENIGLKEGEEYFVKNESVLIEEFFEAGRIREVRRAIGGIKKIHKLD